MDTIPITTVNAPPLFLRKDKCKPIAADANDFVPEPMQHRVEGYHHIGGQEVEEEGGEDGSLRYIETGA